MPQRVLVPPTIVDGVVTAPSTDSPYLIDVLAGGRILRVATDTIPLRSFRTGESVVYSKDPVSGSVVRGLYQSSDYGIVTVAIGPHMASVDVYTFCMLNTPLN